MRLCVGFGDFVIYSGVFVFGFEIDGWVVEFVFVGEVMFEIDLLDKIEMY